MRMRRLLLFFALALLPLSPALAGAETLSKDELLRTALRDNQSLKAARARWEMMKQRVPQTKAWDDLMAGVDLQRTGTLNPAKVSDVEWMISQTIPISGKNLSRERASVAEALAAFQELRRVQLDIVTRVSAAYFRLAGAYGQLEINQRRRNQPQEIRGGHGNAVRRAAGGNGMGAALRGQGDDRAGHFRSANATQRPHQSPRPQPGGNARTVDLPGVGFGDPKGGSPGLAVPPRSVDRLAED